MDDAENGCTIPLLDKLMSDVAALQKKQNAYHNEQKWKFELAKRRREGLIGQNYHPSHVTNDYTPPKTVSDPAELYVPTAVYQTVLEDVPRCKSPAMRRASDLLSTASILRKGSVPADRPTRGLVKKEVCFNCKGTNIEKFEGVYSCISCGVVQPGMHMVSRDRNGNGPAEEDPTVRGDICDEVKEDEPDRYVSDVKARLCTKLRLGGRTQLETPRSMKLAQQITDRDTIQEAILADANKTGVSAELTKKGMALQRALHMHINEGDYIGLFSTELSSRAKRTADALWSRVVAHHKCCSNQCKNDLRACPPTLLSLICMDICLEHVLISLRNRSDNTTEQMVGTEGDLKHLHALILDGLQHDLTTNVQVRQLSMSLARRLIASNDLVETPCRLGDDSALMSQQGTSDNVICQPNPISVCPTKEDTHVNSGLMGAAALRLATAGPYRDTFKKNESEDSSSVSSRSSRSDASIGSPSPRIHTHTPAKIKSLIKSVETKSRKSIPNPVKKRIISVINSTSFKLALQTQTLRCRSPQSIICALAFSASNDIPDNSGLTASSNDDMVCDVIVENDETEMKRSDKYHASSPSPIRHTRGNLWRYACAGDLTAVDLRKLVDDLNQLCTLY